MRGHAPPPSRPSRCADPELVLGLRRFLINYASDPSSPLFSGEQSRALATLLAAALPGVVEDDAAFDCMWRSTPQWRTLGEDLSEVEAGLQALQQLFSRQELAQLVRRAPALLAAPLRPWLEFFEGVGFTEGQVKNLLSTCPELLVQGTPYSAGQAIMHLKEMGFDEDQVRHKVVSWQPQVLMMPPSDIDMLIRLWQKFQVGVDERSGM